MHFVVVWKVHQGFIMYCEFETPNIIFLASSTTSTCMSFYSLHRCCFTLVFLWRLYPWWRAGDVKWSLFTLNDNCEVLPWTSSLPRLGKPIVYPLPCIQVKLMLININLFCWTMMWEIACSFSTGPEGEWQAVVLVSSSCAGSLSDHYLLKSGTWVDPRKSGAQFEPQKRIRQHWLTHRHQGTQLNTTQALNHSPLMGLKREIIWC